MELDEYHALPDGMDKDQVEKIINVFIDEFCADDFLIAVEKLEILSDLQWHCYELPEKEMQQIMTKWLNDNWIENQSFLVLVLKVSHSFGLGKNIYEKALGKYTGSDKENYLKDLVNSKGDYIDPYWSLKKTD